MNENSDRVQQILGQLQEEGLIETSGDIIFIR